MPNISEFQGYPVLTYGVGSKLTECYKKPPALKKPINLPPSVSYQGGQLLGQVGQAQDDVQTITPPGSGSYTLSGVNPLTLQSFTTAAIAYNASDAAILAALNAAVVTSPYSGLNAPTVVGTGSLGPASLANGATAGLSPISGGLSVAAGVVTWGGAFANRPVPLMTASAGSVAHTTVGQTAGTYAAYSGMLAAPTAAPTVAGAGSGSSFGAGDLSVSYTLSTASGETTPSPASQVTLTAGQDISVTSITGLNAAVTAVNFYVDGALARSVAPSGGATGAVTITGAAPAAGRSAPAVNSAAIGGTPSCFLEYPTTTDALGNVNTSANFTFQSQPFATAFFSGAFSIADLIGLDANAAAALGGRVASGSIASGQGTFIF